MKAFMDKDFMLQSATAQHLYHDYAAAMPICDSLYLGYIEEVYLAHRALRYNIKGKEILSVILHIE